MQKPPMYSAIKVDGKKLYEYAREGISIDDPTREIEIFDIKLLEYNLNEIRIEVKCSKGTYIRTLCEDIAQKLGTVGYMKALIRIEVNKFVIEDAITLDELEIQKEQIQMMPAFITMEKCFNDLPKIEIPNKIKYLNGQLQNVELSDGIYNIYFEGEYIGIGVVKNNILKRDIVI